MNGDLVIRDGFVVDGTGAPGRPADVLVEGGRIVAVGQVGEAAHRPELDAAGAVVAPGFIDVHTHYDAQICWDTSFAGIGQYGVTTVLMGNCGIGMAPLLPGGSDFLIQLLARVEGMPIEALQQVDWSWRTFADYLDAVDRPLGVNVMAMVGHSPLRHAAMGIAASERAATDDELAAMEAELRSALEAGAWGFSSSVAATHNDLAGRPAPSRLADRREFEALADALGTFDFGVVGISPESKLRGLSADDRELLQLLSLRGGASVNWNPLVHSPSMPELSQINLSALEEAAEAGAQVYGVFNPASTGGTRVDLDTLFLFSFLPHWKPLSVATRAERVAAFSDPAVRRDLAHDLEHDTSMGVLTAQLRSMWDILRITTGFTPETQQHVGRTVGEVAAETGRSPLDTLLDLAVADDLRTVFMQEDTRHSDEESIAAFKALSTSPHVLYGGSDAGAHIDMLANESLPARALEYRVRDEGSVALEEMVRRFTSDIATGIGLGDRGTLAPGMAGDVVVFDLDEVGAGDAYVVADLPGGGERMMSTARGVRATVVAGDIAFRDGAQTDARAGRLLRSGR